MCSEGRQDENFRQRLKSMEEKGLFRDQKELGIFITVY